MFPIIRPSAQRRPICDGRVLCPVRQSDVDFELCASCGMATEIQAEGDSRYVRCRPEVAPASILIPYL